MCFRVLIQYEKMFKLDNFDSNLPIFSPEYREIHVVKWKKILQIGEKLKELFIFCEKNDAHRNLN
jgi:hypothetical protein